MFNVQLVSFAAGGWQLNRALARLSRNATAGYKFQNISLYTQKSLLRIPDFWNHHREFINTEKKGFGRWIWKPFIVLDALERAPEDSLLLYVDAGCDFNWGSTQSKKRFKDYLQIATEHESLTFRLNGSYPERSWSHPELIRVQSLNSSQTDENQIHASCFLLKNNNKSREFVREWCRLSSINNYQWLITDSDSVLTSGSAFINRHDQSIFSTLVKSTGRFLIDDETYWGPEWGNRGANFPIWAMRNKTGVDLISPHSHKDFIDCVVANSLNLIRGIRHN